MKTLITILLMLPLMANAAKLTVHNYPESDNKFVYIQGGLTLGDDQRLKTLLSEHPTITGVALRSGGGNTYSAKLLAQTIRTNDLSTFVSAEHKCASACVNVFLGGKTRYAYKTSRFGIHPSHMTSASANDSINDVFNDGQRHAMEYAYEWAKYVEAGKEFKAIKYLRAVYNQTTHKDMFWANPVDLKELSVITHLMENK